MPFIRRKYHLSYTFTKILWWQGQKVNILPWLRIKLRTSPTISECFTIEIHSALFSYWVCMPLLPCVASHLSLQMDIRNIIFQVIYLALLLQLLTVNHPKTYKHTLISLQMEGSKRDISSMLRACHIEYMTSLKLCMLRACHTECMTSLELCIVPFI